MCKPQPKRCKHCTKTTCPMTDQARRLMRRLGTPDFFSLMEHVVTKSSATTYRGSRNEF